MENNRDDDPTEILSEEPKTVIPRKSTLVIKDEHTGEKIKNAAEVVGFIGAIIALIAGFIIWFQTSSVVGFLIGLLIAVGGIFFSYFIVLLSQGYVNMIANSMEQTKILKRIEAQNVMSLLEIADATALEPAADAETMNQAAKTNITAANPDDHADEDAPDAPEPQIPEDKRTGAKWPLVGVIDTKMRRLAHFEERSKYGIICPICSRKQSSNTDNCYFCDCRFIYDNEQPRSWEQERLDRLRNLTAK